MCGINGIIARTEWSWGSRIDAMNATVHHRGPDAQSTSMATIGGSAIYFGHVRLAIRDLSDAGRQPMWYQKSLGRIDPKEGQYCAVFNGEIYNFESIRDDLVERGYVFTTTCDTEVLLAAYQQWGRECVHRFNWFWAFAILDPFRQEVFFSRDRFGKKSLYFSQWKDVFVFSSELKWVLTGLNITPKACSIDHDAIDLYLAAGFIPAPWTIYQDIQKLEAGYHGVLSLESGAFHKERYYYLPEYAPTTDRNALIQQGKDILADATRIRMSADVPVGAFLSGGLDSSTVVSLMREYTDPSRIHTFSIGFDGVYDETSYINIVKDAFSTQHHHQYYRREDFDREIDAVIWAFDEPFADIGAFPTYSVSQLARQHVTVALSGDGGDEVFGGYQNHRLAVQIQLLYRLPTWIKKWVLIMTRPLARLACIKRLREWCRVTLLAKSDFYAEIGKDDFLFRPKVYQDWTRQKMSELLMINDDNFVQTMIDFDLMYNTLSDHFLTKVDRMSMQHALEVRSPFLDYRLVEYARTIPVIWKVSLSRTKILMRDIIATLVPSRILNRWKQGFTPPILDWLGSIPELSPEVRAVLSPQAREFYADVSQRSLTGYERNAWVRFYLLEKWMTHVYK